jgi:NADH-quinone oxidoreductase subunit E
MSIHPTLAAMPTPAGDWKEDEAALLTLLDDLERKHGFIPQTVADELGRLVEMKLDRIRRIQQRLESDIRRDVQRHVEAWRHEEGNLIMILHAIQNQYGYVPREVAMELSRELGVKLARIYEVITFYHYFRLQPQGRHNISVCNGTACYLKGAQALIDELRSALGINEGGTTADRAFHYDVVRCIGCCGMSPALVIDGKTHGRLKTSDVRRIIEETRARETVS